MIHKVPAILPLLYPAYRWRFPETERVLYLTFDDGPVYGPTEAVLEILKAESIPATFFCIGDNVRKHPKVFRQIMEDGHAIGNHTFNHLNGWRTKTADYLKNVQTAAEVMRENGFQSKGKPLFRPPYGRITQKEASQLQNYAVVMWDVLTLDYDKSKSPESVLNGTLRAIRPGSIIVFHDSLKAERNMLYALKGLIDYSKKEKYIFSKIIL